MAIILTSCGCVHSSQHQSYCSDDHDGRTRYPYATYCAYSCSDIKSNSWRAGSYGLNMLSITKERRALSGVRRLDFPGKCLALGYVSDYSFIAPWKATSVELGLVCEDESRLIQKEKIDTDMNPVPVQKSPPRGDLRIQLHSGFETNSANQSSTVTKRKNSVDEKRVYLVEERNGVILSENILSLSRLNKVRSATELYRSMEIAGLRPTLHACNSLISCLLRKGMLDDALRIVETMITSETITGHTYSLVLKAIANARGCDAALNMFEELQREGNVKRDFDAIAYNTMIAVCCKVNNWVQTLRIWRIMKFNGLTGTPVTYRLLVCIFVRCGQNELAIDAYNEMIQNGLNAGDDAMQAIIGACSKEGKWELALNIFQNMLRRGSKPSLITCNALINSLGKDGKVKLSFDIHSLMKSLGHESDSYTWNALLGALYRANRHADALQLFEKIKKEQPTVLNSHLYNTCLMCCQTLGLWEKALQLLWQMESSGHPVSTASYNLVIRACEVARKPKIALQVYEHMVQQKCAPDTFTLSSLIRGCIWGSLWHEVEDLVKVSPDASLYNAAIQGMCLRGKIGLATKLYTKMRESSLIADGKTRALMLQNLPRDSSRLNKR